MFGWVFAGHQIGAASIAWFAGVTHVWTGSYRLSLLVAGTLCLVAALATQGIRNDGPTPRSSSPEPGPPPDAEPLSPEPLSPGVGAGRA